MVACRYVGLGRQYGSMQVGGLRSWTNSMHIHGAGAKVAAWQHAGVWD